tara:strand:+ start:9927 stop:13352 length:3426 start_codon:yes stop_codon:yes gene_type:complete
MSYHNGDSSSSSSSPQRIAAPPGFHYMPDGSLMADSEMNAQQRVMGTDDPIMNPQREPCVQQMSCAPGYYWSQRHCNCMTNEELTGPYDFGGPRLANPNESNEVEINRRNAQGQTAPDGFHYMPDGTLMSDADHARLGGGNSMPLEKTPQKYPLNPTTPPSPSANSVYVDPANFDCSNCMNVVTEYGWVFNSMSNTHTRALGWQQAGWEGGELAKNGQNIYQLKQHFQYGVFAGRTIHHFNLASDCSVSLVRDIPYPFSSMHNMSVSHWIGGSGMCYAYTAGDSDVLVLGSAVWNNLSLQWYNSQSGSSSPIPLNMGGLWLTKVGIPGINTPPGTPLYLAPSFQTPHQIAGDLVYIPSDNSFVGSFGVGSGAYVRHFKAPQGVPSGTIPQAVDLGTHWWPTGGTAFSMWSNGDDVYTRALGSGVSNQTYKFDLSSHTLIPSSMSSLAAQDAASSPSCPGSSLPCDLNDITQEASDNLYPLLNSFPSGSVAAQNFFDTFVQDMWSGYLASENTGNECQYWQDMYNAWGQQAYSDTSLSAYDVQLLEAQQLFADNMLVLCCGDPADVAPPTTSTHKVGNPGGIIKKVTKRGNKKIDGWVLTPSGGYITEAVFQETYGDRLEKVITKFKLNLADLTATTETRSLEIIGDHGASFILEIKNAAGNYYNFYTKTFASTRSFLDEELYGGSYINEVVFPASGSDDQYDVFLHAKPGTKHISYIEKRFGDNSIDLNGSIGSNSLLLQKVIYQYNSMLTLTLSGYSASGDITATMGTTSVEIDRYKEKEDTAFSFTTTAAPTAAFRILKQPLEEDVLSFIQPTLASEPATLQGENIYPDVTGTDTVNGARDASAVAVTMDSAVATKMAVGDRVTGNAALNAGVFTVVSLDSTNVFSISSAVAIADGVTLSFSNQVNHSWPVNNFVNLIQEGMILAPGTNVPANTTVKAYSDKTTTSLGTKEERTRVSKILPAVSTKGLKPTVVKGLVTTQAGDITFSNQLPLSLGGTAMKIGGYGESEALRLYGWDIQFTDLEITLTPPTTTTREASAGGSSADIDVNSKEGVINNVSRVSGVGINPALQNPLITAGGGATGTGDWTMDAAQTLENGTILTVENTSRVATITGNIRINKAGNASQILRFDVDKLLSTSA